MRAARGADGKAISFLLRFIESEERGIGRLLRGDVLAGAFAEFLRCLGDVEDVIDDLEGEAEAFAEIGEAGELLRRGVGRHRAEPDGTGDERGGFVVVDVPQFSRADFLALAFEIGHLSGDEFLAACGHGEFVDDGGVGITGPCAAGGGHFKRDGEQRVAGEHGDAFAVDLVRGRFAPGGNRRYPWREGRRG